jgi:hypothetical protein
MALKWLFASRLKKVPGTFSKFMIMWPTMQENTSEKIRTEIYRRMAPVQKLEEAFRLRELAWTIKAASIRSMHPDWNEQAIDAEVRKIFLYAFT